MSGGAPKVLSMNISEQEPERWLVLGPAGNKTRSLSTTQKPLKKEEEKKKDVLVCSARESSPVLKSTRSAPASVLRRQELLLHSNLSMNASCSSDASTDSFCSRASTGRIGRGSLTGRVGRRQGLQRTEKIAAKLEKAMVVPEDGEVRGAPALSAEFLLGKRRCAWVMPNTDPQYAVFHDEEWGVPVHNDRKLFELLVLSGALAELTWPTILSKRHIFREVFVDFDPVPVSKLNEKKLIVPGGTASSLLSEPKLRAIIENARQLRKIIDEFGSFDRYCWAFVNHKPITSRFRYPRQVPAKTPKADVISKDLVRRGFRSVSPTVIYTFMQVAGLTNDHLITCYRFEECAAAAASTIVTSSEEVKSNITCDSKKEG